MKIKCISNINHDSKIWGFGVLGFWGVRVFRDKEEMYFVLGWLHKNKNQMVYVEDEGNLPSENILKLLEVDEDSK